MDDDGGLPVASSESRDDGSVAPPDAVAAGCDRELGARTDGPVLADATPESAASR